MWPCRKKKMADDSEIAGVGKPAKYFENKPDEKGPKLGKDRYAVGWTAKDEVAEKEYIAASRFKWSSLRQRRTWFRAEWWCEISTPIAWI
jgi:hypothetical protein